jgi:integrase/recombinase XerD
MTTEIIDFQTEARRIQPNYLASPSLSIRLSELLPLWLAARRSDNRRPRGIKSYNWKFGRFINFAGDIPIEQLDQALIRRFKLALAERCAATTVRGVLSVVRAFCEWCVVEEYCTTNPALQVPHPRIEDTNPNPLTHEQVSQLLAALEKPFRTHAWTQARTYRLIVLMLNTGLRISEAAGLRMHDLDFDRRLLTVRREIAKNGKVRTIPINTPLLLELQKISHFEQHWGVIDQGDYQGQLGQPLSYQSTCHIFNRVLPRLIDFHVSSHQLRKTFATELYINGENIITIQRLLGHTDPKTTMRYIGLSAQLEHEAVERLVFAKKQ